MAEIEATMMVERAMATELWARLEGQDISAWTDDDGCGWRARSSRR
jgi:hypothetical protein